MKVLVLAFLVALAPTVSFAQHGGGGHGGGGGGFHGGGGMGGGFRGGAVGGFSGGGFRGGSVSGFRGGSVGVSRGFVGTGFGRYGYGYGRYGYGLGFGIGWGWPYWGWGWGWGGWGGWGCDPYVFNCWGGNWGLGYGGSYPGYGGYYGDPSSGDASSYYPSTSGYGGGSAQAPVVINQQYGNPAAPSSGSGYYRNPDYYLIAFTDHTIQAALTYHVEGDTLHYTTMQHEERTAPLSSVDRSFSQQLNRDRRVNFQLP